MPQLLSHYPRGHKQLRPLLARFGPRETMLWFEERGVRLKTEADGRVFPVSDHSESIVDCLLETARSAGVELHCRRTVKQLNSLPGQSSSQGESSYEAQDREGCWRSPVVLLATGGSAASHPWLENLGHHPVPLVPSLFTFNEERFTQLSGLSLERVKVSFAPPLPPMIQEGPLLFTHWGLSGPVILKLSAWGARVLADVDYRAKLRLDLLPGLSQEDLRGLLHDCKHTHPRRVIANDGPLPLPKRLWRALCLDQGSQTWGETPDRWLNQMAEECKRMPLNMLGKGTFKEEFVAAGGVPLREVDLKSLESLHSPGLFLAGEVLDVDGLTGGFNLQSAWAGGWVAGTGMAERLRCSRG